MRAFVPLSGLLVLLLAPEIAAQTNADEAPTAVPITVDVHKVLFPFTTDSTLDDGQVEMDRSRGRYAVRIDVDPPEDRGGWTLYVRADRSAFQPEGTGKPCTDLKWKFDREGATAYRPVLEDDSIVLERPEGGSAELTVDVAVDLDWCTVPGSYSIGLIFELAYP